MTLKQWAPTFPWARYGKKVTYRITHPRSVGSFDPKEAQERGMKWVKIEEGSLLEGNCLIMEWLVDEEDGVLVDIKYHAYGQSALIAALESAAEWLIGKPYLEAQKLSLELIDFTLREKGEEKAFPEETHHLLHLVLEAVKNGVIQCRKMVIQVLSSPSAPPTTPLSSAVESQRYPGWESLTTTQKLVVIEEVIAQEIRPYIAMDEGGIEIISFTEDRELKIAYQGACTSCYSSIGSTLSAIQEILRNKIDPNLSVIADLDSLDLH